MTQIMTACGSIPDIVGPGEDGITALDPGKMAVAAVECMRIVDAPNTVASTQVIRLVLVDSTSVTIFMMI